MRQMNREDLVRQFMKAVGQPVDLDAPDKELLEFRFGLITEEVKELGEEIAWAMADVQMQGELSGKVKARMLKELADVQYVISGLAETLGLPLEEAFIRVHNSNMSKLDDDGKPIKNDVGKVLKGPNYRPPHLDDLVGED